MTASAKQTMTRVAYARLKDDILSMQLAPRQPLVEAELCAMLDMSKTPIREALLGLAHDGLVELNEFRGARVRDFTFDDAREIYELRALLEPEALRRSYPAMDAELFAELRSLLDRARERAEAGDRAQLAAFNRQFHAGLIRHCDNQRLLGILGQFSDQVRLISLRSWIQQPTYVAEAAQHRAILDALELDRDVDLAAQRLRDHVLDFLGHLAPSVPAAATR